MATPDYSSEIWKDIPEWEGLYQVSSLGRVRSLDRTCVKTFGRNKATVQLRGRMLAPVKAGKGYRAVTLSAGGRVVKVNLHRLVCRTFHGEPKPDQQAAHLNGDRTDNRASNLMWATVSENHLHKRAHGTARRGENNNLTKLSADQVLRIRSADFGPRGQIMANKRGLANELGINVHHINHILARTRRGDP